MAFTVNQKVIAKKYRKESVGADSKFIKTLGVSLFFLVGFVMNATAARMSDIEFSALPGDKTEIRMMFDGRPPAPTGYTIEQPARIALDLDNVTSGLASKYHSLGTGNARSVTVIEAGDRTRVIVALGELVAYSTRIEGRSLYVLVGKQDSGSFDAEDSNGLVNDLEQPMESGYASGGTSRVEDVDFRRGERGEGRVIVQLSDPSVDVDRKSVV